MVSLVLILITFIISILMSGYIKDLLLKNAIEEESVYTTKLKENIDKLERYKDVTVGRELRIIQLKKEINDLCKKYGKKAKYKTDFEKLEKFGRVINNDG